MQSLLQNTFVAILFGGLFAGIIVFAWVSIYWKDKYSKASDDLLKLANNSGFFTKKPSVMRQDEKQLFDILMKAFGDKYFIFPQMKLSNVLDVKNNLKDHDNLYREIDHRSLDFVFFDKQNISPVLAIELNGESHQMYNRINRDQVIEDILTKANIKFIAINKMDNYELSILLDKINGKLKET